MFSPEKTKDNPADTFQFLSLYAVRDCLVVSCMGILVVQGGGVLCK